MSPADPADPLLVMGPAPAALAAIRRATERLGFALASDDATGALLRALAAGKPGGRLLELGTGTGVATAWLLDGMDPAARLTSVDADARISAVAREHLGGDPRLELVVDDGAEFLRRCAPRRFDLIFADAWPGKYDALDAALDLLAPGGQYVVDDLLPQPTWPRDHQATVERLLDALARRPGLRLVRLAWSTGIAVATRGA